MAVLASCQTDDAPKRENRRRGGRVRTHELVCEGGGVIDLSPEGLRIETRRFWRQGSRRTIHLSSGSEKLNIRVRCVWRTRIGFRRYVVGLHFEQCSPEATQTIARFARSCGACSALDRAA